MKRFRLSRSSALFGAIVIILVAQLAWFRPVRDAVRVTVAVPSLFLGQIGSRIGGAFGVLFAINDLSEENSRLRLELQTTQAELAKLKNVEGENNQLRLDLNFSDSRPDLKLIAAQIMSYSPQATYQTMQIKRGTNDGVKEGQAVVSGGFLVGKVTAVSNQTAEVWLLANRNLVVPVLFGSSQTVGLLRGGIRGLVVDNIPTDTKIIPGDPVVTSELEGLFPAGIAVGQVEEIISQKEEIFLAVRIRTPLNTNNLSQVFVVTR